jgi:hypothetical protein
MKGFDGEMPDYESSDAWLLLSVIYASRDHPATLGEILMVGDYINHTSFTQEELDDGFSRLKTGGWIVSPAAAFSVTAKTSEAYQAIVGKGLSASGELREIEFILGVKNAS